MRDGKCRVNPVSETKKKFLSICLTFNFENLILNAQQSRLDALPAASQVAEPPIIQGCVFDSIMFS